MGLVGYHQDTDSVFEKMRARDEPLRWINDMTYTTESDLRELRNLLRTTNDDPKLNSVPSCNCGKVKLGANLGKIAPCCRTKVEYPFQRSLEPLVWMRAPQGVVSLMNPNILLQLRHLFHKANYNVIDWLIYPRYRPAQRDPVMELESLRIWMNENGLIRGWNCFITNFRMILEHLINQSAWSVKRSHLQWFLMQVDGHEESIFPKCLPIINSKLVTVDKTDMGQYSDDLSVLLCDAISHMIGIDAGDFPMKSTQVQARVAAAMIQLSRFCEVVAKGVYSRKSGLVRRQLLGYRSHTSGRGVITSVTGVHDHDTIGIPWCMAVTMYSMHIASFLIKKNKWFSRPLTYGEAMSYIYKHTHAHSPIIEEIWLHMFGKHGEKKKMLNFVHRNPTMRQTAIQGMWPYVTDGQTIRISDLATAGPNADYDGDNMDIYLVGVDKFMTAIGLALAPHRSAISPTIPGTFNTFMRLPPPDVSNLVSLMSEPFDQLPVPTNRRNIFDELTPVNPEEM